MLQQTQDNILKVGSLLTITPTSTQILLQFLGKRHVTENFLRLVVASSWGVGTRRETGRLNKFKSEGQSNSFQNTLYRNVISWVACEPIGRSLQILKYIAVYFSLQLINKIKYRNTHYISLISTKVHKRKV